MIKKTCFSPFPQRRELTQTGYGPTLHRRHQAHTCRGTDRFNERTNERMAERTAPTTTRPNERNHHRTRECANQRPHERTNDRTKERTDGWPFTRPTAAGNDSHHARSLACARARCVVCVRNGRPRAPPTPYTERAVIVRERTAASARARHRGNVTAASSAPAPRKVEEHSSVWWCNGVAV